MATVCDPREPRTKSRFFPGLFGPIGVFGQSPWIDPAYLQHWEYMFRPELAAAAASAAANPAGPTGGGGGPPTSTPTGSTSPASTTTSPAAPGFRLPLAGLMNKVRKKWTFRKNNFELSHVCISYIIHPIFWRKLNQCNMQRDIWIFHSYMGFSIQVQNFLRNMKNQK